jgi:purine catabolism regulator
VSDLAERNWHSSADLVARARVVGLPFSAEGQYAVLMITDLRAVDVDAVIRAVAGALTPRTALVADLGEDVVAVVRTAKVTDAANAVLRAVDTLGGDASRVVTGSVVNRLEDIDRSITRARAAMALPSRGERILVSEGMTTQLLLGAVRGESLAGQLVQEEIGRLTDHDDAHGTELVRTLRTYLTHASSKVQTAEALRLRRQTLYGRLQRIEELIGDISDPQRHTSLVLALALNELIDREPPRRPLRSQRPVSRPSGPPPSFEITS